MTGLANGIAHVSFPGGGAFLPARSPYDRQMLIEHVAHRLHAEGRVQVLLDEQRWLVQSDRGAGAPHCAACACPVSVACYAATNGVAYCPKCAFGYDIDAQPEREPTRRAG